MAICLALSLSSNVFAANKSAFYVNNAYFKGDGKYDVVVHDSNRDTLRLYLNGKNPVKAKVNKQGWATFQKVKLTGQSKLSFTKKISWFKYTPVDYTRYISVDGKQVKLSDIGAKHSYDDFYAWFTSEQGEVDITYNNLPHLYSGSSYQIITATCEDMDNSFGSTWTACMQEGYKDYLKPSTFVGDNWMGDYGTMVGDMNYVGLKNDQYKKAMQEAQTIYGRLAITN